MIFAYSPQSQEWIFMANDIDFSFEVAGSFSSFKVESFRVSEAVSTPFEMNLTVLSEDEEITF